MRAQKGFGGWFGGSTGAGVGEEGADTPGDATADGDDDAVEPAEHAATISAIATRNAKGRVTSRTVPQSSAGALSLDPSGAGNRPGSAQVTPQAHRGMSCAGAATPGRRELVEGNPEDRPFDLVELLVGRPPRLTEPLFPVAPGASGQEAVEQPPHDRSLSLVRHT